MADVPELQQLLGLARDRTAYQNPLFQAVSQMAYMGLPTYARQGTSLSGSLSNQAPAPMPTGGGMSPTTAGLLGGLAGAGLNSLGPNGNMLGALIDGLKKLLSTKTKGIQGNRPYPGGALTGGGQPALYPFPGMAGNEGMDPNLWPGGNPSVTTEESFPGLFPDNPFPDSPTGGGLYPNLPGAGVPLPGLSGGLWVGSSRVDLQACKLEYSIVSPK